MKAKINPEEVGNGSGGSGKQVVCQWMAGAADSRPTDKVRSDLPTAESAQQTFSACHAYSVSVGEPVITIRMWEMSGIE